MSEGTTATSSEPLTVADLPATASRNRTILRGSEALAAAVVTWDAKRARRLRSFPSRLARLAAAGLERTVALLCIVLFAPVGLLIAAIIRRGTRGPALFWQKRVGRDGRLFNFVKFRTMYSDARTRSPKLYLYDYSDRDIETLKFKIPDDPRVSPQGEWLRRSSLDELPNFWNVLRGDMALIGPRPEIPEMLPYYSGSMLLKFTIRPGITGLAQVSGRGRLGFLETVALDVEYVRNRSWRLDAWILMRTVRIVLLGDGAF